jgi:hypothetical protein
MAFALINNLILKGIKLMKRTKYLTYFKDLTICLKAGTPRPGIKAAIKYRIWIIWCSSTYLLNRKNKVRLINDKDLIRKQVGQVWKSYQLWLNFMYKYISIKEFTFSPAVDSVSGPTINSKASVTYSKPFLNNKNVEDIAKNMTYIFLRPTFLKWKEYISIFAGLWDSVKTYTNTKNLSMIIEIGGGQQELI